MMRYILKRSDRKTLAIEIKGGEVIVRAPRNTRTSTIEKFLLDKMDWITENVEKQKEKAKEQGTVEKLTRAEVKHYANLALKIIPPLVEEYADIIGVTYGNITIRAQKTRWGSCSKPGNLNFNCMLVTVPEHALRYVVVHELCHRVHMNHSKDFWNLVGDVMPDYKLARKWLKDNGSMIINRLP